MKLAKKSWLFNVILYLDIFPVTLVIIIIIYLKMVVYFRLGFSKGFKEKVHNNKNDNIHESKA